MFVGTGLAFYYVVVLAKYYRNEIRDLIMGKKRRPKAPDTGGGPAEEGGPGQGDLFGDKLSQEQVPELYKVMEKVIGQLKGVMDSAVIYKMNKDELTDHLQAVLGNYRQLKKTPYQVSINNYLTRICASQFSLALDERKLESMWG